MSLFHSSPLKGLSALSPCMHRLNQAQSGVKLKCRQPNNTKCIQLYFLFFLFHLSSIKKKKNLIAVMLHEKDVLKELKLAYNGGHYEKRMQYHLKRLRMQNNEEKEVKIFKCHSLVKTHQWRRSSAVSALYIERINYSWPCRDCYYCVWVKGVRDKKKPQKSISS